MLNLFFILFFPSVFSQTCKNPLLDIQLNIWAPYEKDLIATPQKYSPLSNCKYLEETDICCSNLTIIDYSKKFNVFKGFLDTENYQQNRYYADIVESVFENRADIKKLFASTNETSTSLQNQTNNIDFGNITNTEGMDSNNLPVGFLENFKEIISQNENGINSTIRSIRRNLNIESNLTKILNLNGDIVNYFANLNETQIDYEIDHTLMRYQALKANKTKCFSSLFRHFSSLFCLSCEADYLNKGIDIQENIIDLTLNMNSCVKFVSDCYGYIESLVEMNKNVVFFSYIETLKRLQNENYISTDLLSIERYINQRTTALISILNNQLLFRIPSQCDLLNCEFICNKYILNSGLSIEEIINGTLIDMNGNKVQIMVSSITTKSANYANDTNSVDSYLYAEKTGFNYSVDGGAGIVLFGKKKIGIQTEGRKIIGFIDLFIFIIFFMGLN